MGKDYGYISTDIDATLKKYDIPPEAKDDVAESIHVGEQAALEFTFSFM